MIFAIADTHLSCGVQKPMDIFGARWKGWTDSIIKNWCETVKDGDTVVIPGDISWGMSLDEAKADLEFIDRLPGRKIICKGNHDYWWSTVTKIRSYFKENGIESIDILYNSAFEADGKVICGSRGWFVDEKTAPKDADYTKIVEREAGRLKLSIADGKRFDEDKERIAFFHFPPVFGDIVCEEIINVLKENGVSRCFYGHIHGRYDIPRTFEYDGISFTIVSADYLDFKPLRIC